LKVGNQIWTMDLCLADKNIGMIIYSCCKIVSGSVIKKYI